MASIKCGNCKGSHETRDQVKNCYGFSGKLPETPLPAPTEETSTEQKTQEALLAIWLNEQEWSDFAQSLADSYSRRGYLTPKQFAAGLRMKEKCEKKNNERDGGSFGSLPDVAEGHYAIENFEGHEVRYFKVDRPTEGRWAGRTFVKEQASDELYPVRGERARKVLEAIAGDPEAGPRYGKTIGKCWMCNRTLTDDTSRDLGIGPVCREK